MQSQDVGLKISDEGLAWIDLSVEGSECSPLLGVGGSGVMTAENVGNALVCSNNINEFSIFPYEFRRRPSTKDIFRKVADAADEIISDGARHAARVGVGIEFLGRHGED
jgi:hypothetical protein